MTMIVSLMMDQSAVSRDGIAGSHFSAAAAASSANVSLSTNDMAESRALERDPINPTFPSCVFSGPWRLAPSPSLASTSTLA
jgi:hypothetical protein